MTKEQAGLHEQALNKAAEIGISSQLDQVDNVEVDIKADPFKLMTGEVDAVQIKGEGMVMQQDLRMEKIEMQMGRVGINPMQAAMGQIELTKPADGSAEVVLTEADINRAFNSDYISGMLKNMEVNIDGKPTTIDTQEIKFSLPSDNKVGLNATVLLRDSNETQQIAFTAVPRVRPNGQGVVLEDVEYAENKELSPELTNALLEKSAEILDFSNFDLEGMSLKINRLDVKGGKLTMQAAARVEKIPSA
ncbi:DUF2993 domain-containing protein [Microcoleus sp. FACHB-672]|uniref:LmeA family phospholipid-binding protein n=1 Tax=Microcoleus sp. FACHB-672 TaxID=2692825 RepID=UPI001686CFDB|nr:LmeA family phospholipid-binding protein [Microcoleus sp. FACHB-672]MBD2039565.1 DUF2993 domain-containing protein [Microcoleus sp. FACHB-672]